MFEADRSVRGSKDVGETAQSREGPLGTAHPRVMGSAVLNDAGRDDCATDGDQVGKARSLSILVVDDERLIRDLLTAALEQRLPDGRVDTASGFASAIEHLERRPDSDVVVLDYKMGDMRGVSSVAKIVKAAKKGRVIVLSGHVTDALAGDLRRIGVAAALTKDVGMSTLAEKIADVVNGEQFFELPTSTEKLTHIQNRFALSKREVEIFHHIVQGDRNADIAFKLGISEATVRVHVYHVYKKLGVTSRIEAFNCWNAVPNGVSGGA